MNAIQILVTCDSSPVHIALARGVPVVGVYVNDATFRMSPTLENEHFICLNSIPPCFAYSWRWKFFCGTLPERGDPGPLLHQRCVCLRGRPDSDRPD